MRACLVQFFVTLWTVARQAPLSMGILQARILEWVVISYSRGFSKPRDQSHTSTCLLHWQAGSLPLASPGKFSEDASSLQFDI